MNATLTWKHPASQHLETGSLDSLSEEWKPKGGDRAGPLSVSEPGSSKSEAGILLASWFPVLI